MSEFRLTTVEEFEAATANFWKQAQKSALIPGRLV